MTGLKDLGLGRQARDNSADARTFAPLLSHPTLQSANLKHVLYWALYVRENAYAL